MSQKRGQVQLIKAAATHIREIDADRQSQRETRFLRWQLRLFADITVTSTSEIESAPNELLELTKEVLELEVSVGALQDKFFDGHPILFRNVEDVLKQALEIIRNAINTFKSSFPFKERADVEAMRQKIASIDMEMLKKQARAAATIDILRESGLDEELGWLIARAVTASELEITIKRHREMKSRFFSPTS